MNSRSKTNNHFLFVNSVKMNFSLGFGSVCGSLHKREEFSIQSRKFRRREKIYKPEEKHRKCA